MSDESATRPMSVSIAGYVVRVATGPLQVFGREGDRPRTVDHFSEAGDDAVGYFAVAVDDGHRTWPLVVTQRYSPAIPGFEPGVLLVPETGTLFIGAGSRLLGYRSTAGEWRQIFVDNADGGFWEWCRHGDVVLMSAELELARWSIDGVKLWSQFVEPPWDYAVIDDQVLLDVMGTHSKFPAHAGPPE